MKSTLSYKAATTSVEPTSTLIDGLSIVIPVFNEQATLEAVVEQTFEVARQITPQFEILIVDDGSQDASGEIADQLQRRHPRVRVLRHLVNQGFGAAQRTGIGAAQHEFVTVIPSDGQFNVEDLFRLAALAPQSDIVVGYREQREDSLYRRIKTRVFGFVVRRGLGLGLRDVNWVKLYRRSIFNQIAIRSDGIGIEAELIYKAQRLGLRVNEVRVDYLPRTAGVAKGDLPRNVMITIWELLLLRFGRR